jgi:hypothetical protein
MIVLFTFFGLKYPFPLSISQLTNLVQTIKIFLVKIIIFCHFSDWYRKNYQSLKFQFQWICDQSLIFYNLLCFLDFSSKSFYSFKLHLINKKWLNSVPFCWTFLSIFLTNIARFDFENIFQNTIIFWWILDYAKIRLIHYFYHININK